MRKSLVLFEDEGFVNLLPLVFWRSVFELLIGRKIVLDRTTQRLESPVTGVWTRDWLARVAAQRCGAPANQPVQPATVLVNGRWVFNDPVHFPNGPCVGVVEPEVAYIVCDARLAQQLTPGDLLDPVRREAALEGVPRVPAPGCLFHYPWDVIADLPELLRNDWQPDDAVIESELGDRLTLDNPERIHIGEHTRLHHTVVLNTTDGPIYIGHDVEVGAHSVLDGPLYIGPGSRVRPHTWLHGGNTIGPLCKVGGEIACCVIHGYTNKQHAGFLGHAYLGSWVNLGAGATNSDLKNTYGRIRAPVNGQEVDTGLQFFGAIIGDHAKIGINASIPTGAVIGFAASLASTGSLPKYLPSFSWMAEGGIQPGDPLRLLDVASAVMARRNVDMTDDEVELFTDLNTRVKEYEASVG